MNISPGVYSKIIDLSYYLQEVPGTAAFVAYFARKGPDNKLTLYTSPGEFKLRNGDPNINDYGKKYGQGAYIADNHLKFGGNVYGLRLLPENASYANLFINLVADATANIEVTSKAAGTIRNLSGDIQINEQLAPTNLVDGSSLPLVMFWPEGRGDEYHNIGISLSKSSNPYKASEGVYILNVYQTSSDKTIDEIRESFEVSFYFDAVNDSGDNIFIEDVVNRYSTMLKCAVNQEHISAWLETELDIDTAEFSTTYTPAGQSTGFTTPAIHLLGGTEGDLVTVDNNTGKRTIDDDVAKALLVNAFQGIIDSSVIDLDDIYFSVVYDAGYPDDVKESINTFVTDLRRDCFAYLDNGDNSTIDASVTARSNNNDMNSFYSGMFEPYTKVYDSYTGKDIWVSPVYHMSSMVSKNDALYNLWMPNAGYNRATISSIKEMRWNAKQNDRDRLYLNQINPIVKFTAGYTVWGNLTTQKRPSKLSNISTVRTVLYIKRALEQFVKYYIFEFSNSDTYQSIAKEIESFLEPLKKAKALNSYDISVGASDYERKNKTCHVNLKIEPADILEKISLNFYIV